MNNGSVLSITQYLQNNLGTYKHDGMEWHVRLLDARMVYGRIDILISPVTGRGQKWVEKSTIVVNKEA